MQFDAMHITCHYMHIYLYINPDDYLKNNVAWIVFWDKTRDNKARYIFAVNL